MWIHSVLLMMYTIYLQTGNTYQDKINTICPESPLQAGEWYNRRLATGTRNKRIFSEKLSPKVGWIMHVIRFILSFNFFIKFCIAIRFCSSYCCMLIRNQKIFFEHFLKNFLAHRVLFRHWLQQFTEIGRAKKPCRPCMQMKTGRI